MNRQQAKDLLPIIQAFAEGKPIEYRALGYEHWGRATTPTFNIASYEYRIKPKPKYRPFEDAEECWQEMLKHQPFGWIKYKEENKYTTYCNIDGNCDFELDFEEYTFADGNIFGIKV